MAIKRTRALRGVCDVSSVREEDAQQAHYASLQAVRRLQERHAQAMEGVAQAEQGWAHSLTGSCFDLRIAQAWLAELDRRRDSLANAVSALDEGNLRAATALSALVQARARTTAATRLLKAAMKLAARRRARLEEERQEDRTAFLAVTS